MAGTQHPATDAPLPPLWIRILRWLTAGVLLLAAGLKSTDLLTGESIHQGLATAAIPLELALALWLWYNPQRRHGSRRLVTADPAALMVAALVFTAFALVTAEQALAGASSCGCFGPLPVPPIATLVLDLGLATALAAATGPTRRMFRMLLPSLAVGLVLPLLLWWRPTPSMAVTADLGPRLMEQIPELQRGRWMVVGYRHDCGHCREQVPPLVAQARREARLVGSEATGLGDASTSRRHWAFLNLGEPISPDPVLEILPPPATALLRAGIHLPPETPVPLALEIIDGVAHSIPLDPPAP